VTIELSCAQLNGGRWFEHGLDLVFEPAHRTVQALNLLEQLAGGVRRAWRREIEALPQQSAASRPEEIAHLQVVEAVLRRTSPPVSRSFSCEANAPCGDTDHVRIPQDHATRDRTPRKRRPR
jgi:hypothetical protein